MALRSAIYPVASIGSTLAFPLFFVGLIINSGSSKLLMDIGILLFAGAVAFSVVTLPVEFNASKRALAFRARLTPDEWSSRLSAPGGCLR
jgi:Zn-dependent membrane protease YugP